jgi:hypothetical protein
VERNKNMIPPLITIRTSWLQNIINRLHIGDMVVYSHTSLRRFENICVIWSILLYYEDTVCSGKEEKLVVISSTITIGTR